MSDLPEILTQCQSIIMLHMNFESRAKEHGDYPSIPIYYPKPPSTLSWSGADIRRPAGTQALLAEGEVALVIGKTAHRVPQDQAWDHVGYVAPANDATVLDFNWSEAPAMLRAKGWDSFTPIGPLVDARTVDPNNISLRLSVNGEVRQQAHSSQMLFSFAYLVSELSHVMTLQRGDVILCGTPANARPMEPGDEVVVELVGLSTLRNRVVQDDAPVSPLMPKPQVSPRVRAITSGGMAYRTVQLDEQEIKTLRSVSVADLVEQLKKNGVDVTPLSGLAHSGGGERVAGYAYTVRQVPLRADGATIGLPGMAKRSIAAICSVGANEVVVAEGCFSAADTATIVDAIGRQNAAGLVTAGATRAAGGLSVYAGATPAASARVVPVATNLPIELAGQLVSPGDIIVADGRAVIAVPAAAAQLCARQLKVNG